MNPIREAIGVALESGGGNEGETLDDTELPGPAESVASESSLLRNFRAVNAGGQ